MTKAVKVTDMNATIQGYSPEYLNEMKRDGSKFNFVKITEGNFWPSIYGGRSAYDKTQALINNSLRVFGSVGVYHFWHGSPNEAEYFIKYFNSFGMDKKSTEVMLDVDPISDNAFHCMNAINKFEKRLVDFGIPAGNIWLYCSKSWILSGYIVPSQMKYGFIWVADYPYTYLYENESIKPSNPNNPGYNAWQFSGQGRQDWSYFYGEAGQSLFTGSNPQPKPKVKTKHHHVVVKKSVTDYLKSGKIFKTLTSVNGYRDPEFKIRNGNMLAKGSVIHGNILRFKGYTRLDTPIGWFTANAKYLKAVK